MTQEALDASGLSSSLLLTARKWVTTNARPHGGILIREAGRESRRDKSRREGGTKGARELIHILGGGKAPAPESHL